MPETTESTTETATVASGEEINQLVLSEIELIKSEREEDESRNAQADADYIKLRSLLHQVNTVLQGLVSSSKQFGDLLARQGCLRSYVGRSIKVENVRKKSGALTLFSCDVRTPFSVSILLTRVLVYRDTDDICPRSEYQVWLYGTYGLHGDWCGIRGKDWTRARPFLEPELKRLLDPMALTKTIVRALYHGND